MADILIIGDSRLRGLDSHLKIAISNHAEKPKLNITVLPMPGAGIKQVVNNVTTKYQSRMFDQVHLKAGVCDLMHKVSPHNLTPNFPNSESLMRWYLPTLAQAQTDLYSITRTPVLCELVGMDIAAYNRAGISHPKYQEIIDEAIPRVNAYIRHLNNTMKYGRIQAHLCAGYAHKVRGGKCSARYPLVLEDGIHYNKAYKTRVATGLLRAILKNIKE